MAEQPNMLKRQTRSVTAGNSQCLYRRQRIVNRCEVKSSVVLQTRHES
jgi:hypothetical protein